MKIMKETDKPKFVGFATSPKNLRGAQADVAPMHKFTSLVMWLMNLCYVTLLVAAQDRLIYMAKADVAWAV
jgi:hypothetical protein